MAHRSGFTPDCLHPCAMPEPRKGYGALRRGRHSAPLNREDAVPCPPGIILKNAVKPRIARMLTDIQSDTNWRRFTPRESRYGPFFLPEFFCIREIRGQMNLFGCGIRTIPVRSGSHRAQSPADQDRRNPLPRRLSCRRSSAIRPRSTGWCGRRSPPGCG